MKRVERILWGALIALVLPHLSAAQIVYNVTDQGTLGCPFSQANGINQFGHVAGFAQTSTSLCTFSHAFSATPSGGLKDLGTLGGNNSFAQAVNDSGVVAGASDTGDINNSTHAFIYVTKMVDLGTLGGFFSQANAINKFGQVVGFSTTQGEVVFHAFSSVSNGLKDLGTLTGDPSENSAAFGNNLHGIVVGSSDDAITGTTDAVLWDDSGIHDLGTLPGGSFAQANGINVSGHITGFSDSATTGQHAFVNARGTMQDLGTLGGSTSQGNAISLTGDQDGDDSDLVVGTSLTLGDADSHAFVWTFRSGMNDLNNLISPTSGWDLQTATAVNLRGEITGAGTINGEFHAFLLIPINEQ